MSFLNFDLLHNKKNTFADQEITVSTKQELQDAVKKRYGSVIVIGELAIQVGKVYKAGDKLAGLEKVPKASLPVAAGALGITETAVIVAIIALTVILAIALYKNYEIDMEVQVIGEQDELQPKLKLKLKREFEV